MLFSRTSRRLVSALQNAAYPLGLRSRGVHSSADIAAYRNSHAITIQGLREGVSNPILSFEETNFPTALIDALKAEGFEQPTPIQAESWPLASAGRDMISVAKTGSGKTFAFVMPAIAKILERRDARGGVARGRSPFALVLAPTRELTQQIEKEASKVAVASGVKVASLYGGTSKQTQIYSLRNGVDLAVGTPGRINDLITAGYLNLSDVEYLVLDEADRMLDMGFEPQIRSIIAECNPKKQSLFFTATWPKSIRGLAADYLRDPVTINIGEQSELTANSAITQHVHVVSPREKAAKLQAIFADLKRISMQEERTFPKTLVFLSRKSDCDDLAYDLRDLGFPVGTLHGDKTQQARDMILDHYRSNKIKLLIATDVAARGLDVKVCI
jgi:ATP-dependent RNA helicase DDX5/DBP2